MFEILMNKLGPTYKEIRDITQPLGHWLDPFDVNSNFKVGYVCAWEYNSNHYFFRGLRWEIVTTEYRLSVSANYTKLSSFKTNLCCYDNFTEQELQFYIPEIFSVPSSQDMYDLRLAVQKRKEWN